MNTITPTVMARIVPPTPPPISAAWLPDDGASELMLGVVLNISYHIYVYNLKWFISDLHVQYVVLICMHNMLLHWFENFFIVEDLDV